MPDSLQVWSLNEDSVREDSVQFTHQNLFLEKVIWPLQTNFIYQSYAQYKF